jgi:hypothetical protein
MKPHSENELGYSRTIEERERGMFEHGVDDFDSQQLVLCFKVIQQCHDWRHDEVPQAFI